MKNNKLGLLVSGTLVLTNSADAMKTDLFSEIVVIDKDKDVAFGEALDQAHATALTYMANTNVYAGDYQDVKDGQMSLLLPLAQV